MAEAKQRKKFFLDTEFIESGPGAPIDLLSIGIVCEDGREFYAESASANLSMASTWVEENVLPHLKGDGILLGPMGDKIKEFVGDCEPEFWGYYADYDWVVFCQIFGAMIDLPKGWPMFCRDIKQLCMDRGNPQLPEQTSTEHNALNDARWNMEAYDFLAASSRTPQDVRAETIEMVENATIPEAFKKTSIYTDFERGGDNYLKMMADSIRALAVAGDKKGAEQ